MRREAISEMCTKPSIDSAIETNAPNVTIFVTVPSTIDPTGKSSTSFVHGSSVVCLSPKLMRSRCKSTSSTITSTSSPTLTTSEGWLTWFQESSEMCTKPSMPPKSTNAPKSTMLETVPFRRMPRLSLPRISARSARRPSSSSTRRESTTLLRFLSISITRASISVPL